jgi:hypothetical protein
MFFQRKNKERVMRLSSGSKNNMHAKSDYRLECILVARKMIKRNVARKFTMYNTYSDSEGLVGRGISL